MANRRLMIFLNHVRRSTLPIACRDDVDGALDGGGDAVGCEGDARRAAGDDGGH